MCLRAQLATRLLPGDERNRRGRAVADSAAGDRSVSDPGSAADVDVDVLVLGGASGEPLVCPLDTRARAAAAVLSFLDSEPPLLRRDPVC